MNRKLHLLAVFCMIFSLAGAEPALATANSHYPKISSPSGYVVDRNTGRVLFSRDADQSRPIASTTKIMTGLLVLELADLEAKAVISKRVTQTQGGTIGLMSGETKGVRDLLHALMLASANDAAVALAEHIGEGSEEKFVGLMNERAKDLGAVNTNFINPHGLANGKLHFSSAKDLATIAFEAMKRSDFRELVSTRRFTWDSTSTPLPVIIKNTNELLDRYPLAIGIKTGYTSESGYCLVASAAKERRSVIAVVLGSESREVSFADTKILLDWSLNRFDYKPVVRKGRRYTTLVRQGKTIPLLSDRTIVKLVYNSNRKNVGLVLKTRIKPGIKLPVRKGEELGNVIIWHQGEKIGQARLKAARSVSSPYALQNLGGYSQRVFRKIRGLLSLMGF